MKKSNYLGSFTYKGVHVYVYANTDGAGYPDWYVIGDRWYLGYGELMDGLEAVGVEIDYDELDRVRKEAYKHVLP
jgi:hypothetical protein